MRYALGEDLQSDPRAARLLLGEVDHRFLDAAQVKRRTPLLHRFAEGTDIGKGIFIQQPQEQYEVQVLDSWENETYYNGQAGSIYKQYIPLVNASTPPGTWQTYDILFTAPRFDPDSTLIRPGYITVIHNGIVIQNHVELKGPTEYIGIPKYKYHASRLPIQLQNHSNPVSYRNIWIREL